MRAVVGQGAGRSFASNSTTGTIGRGTGPASRLVSRLAAGWRQRPGQQHRRRAECPRCGSRNVTEHYYDTDPETGRLVRVYPGPHQQQQQAPSSMTLPYALVVTALLVVALLLDQRLGYYAVSHLPIYALGLLGVIVMVARAMRKTDPGPSYQVSLDCHACRYSEAAA
jgi:hypothetical protein